MFKYRQQPFMFVVVLAQLVHNVENCLDSMDFYWPQFLQWGFVHLPEASPSVRAFYLFFLAATARRNVHLAIKATWECIAAHWDAMADSLYKRGNGIVVMLFFVTNVNFGLEQQEILNYLDGDVVGTYVADLIPVRNGSQASLYSSISEDLDGLNHVLPAGCTPLNGKTGTGVFSDNESDDFEDQEADDDMETNSLDSANSSSQGTKCPFFGERFADTQKRIREESTFARFDGWALLPVIAKSFDDMRQEVFVLQGLKLFQLIFRKHSVNLWMRYYSIVCTGKDCGLLEVITDAQSLDGLKKKGKKISGVGTSLPKIFEQACGRDVVTGEHDPFRVERARENFISSMAAYSLFSYIFLVKDRHNGNIMLDTEGHVVHIDFGFVLGIAPGNTFSLETAPFKLTPEMVEVMGPDGFDRYRHLVAQGLFALHMEAPQLLSLMKKFVEDQYPRDRVPFVGAS
ncbi:hypothetical protein BBP00_00008374 [Phytophthora kernoviae]|uniref:PI3K/PI4K catalytic domain-containing protein n=1 Tax=Phytophthora kernoviae TaxID=325452 RepID=A0A3F2RFK7_9STRA|nr:hypothetical protein BBP00_00008374 [Phytophthora kernoviae]